MFRIDALRWNPHMEESLAILMEAKECPEDELLVSLVKIQLVMDKVYHLRRDGDKTPSVLYTKAFQFQLESVKEQIPQHLKLDSEFANIDHLANSVMLIQFNRSDTVVPGQCGARHSRSSHPNALLTKCS